MKFLCEIAVRCFWAGPSGWRPALLGLLVVALSGCVHPMREGKTIPPAQRESGGAGEGQAGNPTPHGKVFELPDKRMLRLKSVTADPVNAHLLDMSTNGWLGSDVGDSIVLSDTKTLWLFGDTFIGALSNGVRVGGAPMINSTIGIQNRHSAPTSSMEFFWKEKEGKPVSFFQHQTNTAGSYYWVTKGVMLRGELFLFAYCIEGNDQDASGWKIAGSALIRVPNPLDPPHQWVQKAYPLSLEIGDTFHAGLFVSEPYLYLYGIVKPRKMALARVKIDDLCSGKLVEAYEFWVKGSGGEHWGAAPVNCVSQFRPVTSECAIHYEAAWGVFTCFTYSPSEPEIYLTTAKQLTGPWTRPEVIYRVPEHAAYSFPIISYAVRQHPELAVKPGEVILSYVTNVPGSIKELFSEEGKMIYVPQFLRLELEIDENSGN